MALQGSRLRAKTVEAALAFFARGPWREVHESEIFVVRVPPDRAPMPAAIFGRDGSEPGLAVIRNAVPSAEWERRVTMDALAERAALLDFLMLPLGSIPPARRRFLTQAGFQGRRETLAPSFRASTSDERVREINQTEALTLLYALSGVLAATERGLLRPTRRSWGEDLLVLDLSGDPLAPSVSAEFVTFVEAPPDGASFLAHAPAGLESLARHDARWLIGLPLLPDSEEEAQPCHRNVLIVDEGSKRVVRRERVDLPHDLEGAARIVFEALAGENADRLAGLPREVVFTSRAIEVALGPALAGAGVRCGYTPEHPLFDSIAAGVVDRVFLREAGDERLVDEAPAGSPPPDDLDAWTLASRRVAARLLARAEAESYGGREAAVHYFGEPGTVDEFPDEKQDSPATPAFVEWLAADHRLSPRRPTMVESLLAGPLPESDRRILESRRCAVASLYLIEEVREERSLLLRDIVSGTRCEVRETHLSRSAVAGMLVPARLVEAGRYHLIAPLGPFIPPALADEATEYVRAEGMELTAEGVARSPHLFGRLWTWWENEREIGGSAACEVALREHRGSYQAIFTLEDPEVCRRALEAREDIHFDDEEEHYVWLVAGGSPAGTLGVFERVLVLDVDSFTRFEQASAWLQAIPGVSAVTLHARPKSERVETPTAGGEPPSPSLSETDWARIREHYRRWADQPVPALGGLTPREVCRAEEGRRHVREIVHGLASMDSPTESHMATLQQEMLRALGLDEEES